MSIPGFLGGTDLPAVMPASDCFAVPSIYEPFGMVALEGPPPARPWQSPVPAGWPRSSSRASPG
ncbi:glycosyltransferase [Micromonospora sp. BRA006-A]|nr:glycosyltransferase [Micromonospora sp. BRA006-A]